MYNQDYIFLVLAFWSKLGWEDFFSGWVSEEPDANASTKDEGDNVGDDHRVDKLVFTLGGLEDSEAFGAALGRTILQFGPLLGRENIGSWAPVPDEVWNLTILDMVDVDMAEVCSIWVVFSSIVWTVGRWLGRVGAMGHEGRHPGGGPGTAHTLRLSQHPHEVAVIAQWQGDRGHSATASHLPSQVHPGPCPW